MSITIGPRPINNQPARLAPAPNNVFPYQAPIVAWRGFTIGRGRWISQNRYPRLVGDINGDGYDDIVGFGHTRVDTVLGTGNGTFPIQYRTALVNNFTVAPHGWEDQNRLTIKQILSVLDLAMCMFLWLKIASKYIVSSSPIGWN